MLCTVCLSIAVSFLCSSNASRVCPCSFVSGCLDKCGGGVSGGVAGWCLPNLLVCLVAGSASAQIKSKDIDWRASLIRKQGFEGFSGQFNLLPDGRNQRQYELFQISNNKIRSLKP